jgi:hypothetical protein
MNSFHVVLWLRFGAGAMPCRFSTLHRLVRNIIAEIGGRTDDPIVTPADSLLGDLDDQCLQFRLDGRPARIAPVFGSIEFLGD